MKYLVISWRFRIQFSPLSSQAKVPSGNFRLDMCYLRCVCGTNLRLWPANNDSISLRILLNVSRWIISALADFKVRVQLTECRIFAVVASSNPIVDVGRLQAWIIRPTSDRILVHFFNCRPVADGYGCDLARTLIYTWFWKYAWVSWSGRCITETRSSFLYSLIGTAIKS